MKLKEHNCPIHGKEKCWKATIFPYFHNHACKLEKHKMLSLAYWFPAFFNNTRWNE